MRRHPTRRSRLSIVLALPIQIFLLALLISSNGQSDSEIGSQSLEFNRYDLEVRGLGPRGMCAEDLNGDEIPDLVVANLGHEKVHGSQTLDVFFGRGDGTFLLAQSIPV